MTFFFRESPQLRAALGRLRTRDPDAWLELLLGTLLGPLGVILTGDLVPAFEDAFRVIPPRHPRRTDVVRCQGILDAHLGRSDRARLLLTEVIERPWGEADRPGRALALAYMAWVHGLAGELDLGCRVVAEALELARRWRSARVVAATLMTRGSLEQLLGLADEALETSRDAVDAARSGRAATHELAAMVNVAMMLGQRGEERSAALVRAEALTLARTMRNPALEAAALADGAAAALAAEDVTAARRLADQCGEILVRIGHGLYLANLVRLQAAVAAAEGDLPRARTLAGGHRRWADPGWLDR